MYSRPCVIGYVVTRNGKVIAEEGLFLEDFTEQLRDNPAGLRLEPVILMREYTTVHSRMESVIGVLEPLIISGHLPEDWKRELKSVIAAG